MNDDERRHIMQMPWVEFDAWRADLYRAFDKFMTEEAEHAKRKALASPPESETNGAGLVYRDHPADALYAPEALADGPCFSEDQFEALAFALNELRKEWYGELRRQWQQDIERVEQKLLERTVRLVLPGEMAEQKVYGLNDRLAIMERQLSQAIERQPTGDVRKELRKELAELQRRLDKRDERDQVIIERSGRIAELQRENAIARHETERNEFDKVLAGYRGRVERVERELAMLLRWIGGDLPRGWGGSDAA